MNPRSTNVALERAAAAIKQARLTAAEMLMDVVR